MITALRTSLFAHSTNIESIMVCSKFWYGNSCNVEESVLILRGDMWSMRSLRVLDLCTGIGGLSLACEMAGMQIVGQVEIDPFCQAVLAKHWPDVLRMSDVRKVQGNEFGP